ncbi:MAG TPA: rhomboid family intramembrane serine protease [Cyclobacteriaceae bacterium]|nr:rhomboid family intramembrane serine protease [Cyclobacteriaceae bacterium]
MFNNLSPVVRNLLFINIAVFIIQKVMPVATYYLALYDINSPYFKPYQFFTYMFAHGDFFHILFNMMAFASIAPVLEMYWGDKKFLLFYMATGIGAGVIYALANYFFFPGMSGSMLGASGALYGVLMAFGMIFPNMEVSLFFIPIRAKYLIFVIGGLTFLMDRSGKVAHLAHFGGALIGFIMVSFWRGSGMTKRW